MHLIFKFSEENFPVLPHPPSVRQYNQESQKHKLYIQIHIERITRVASRLLHTLFVNKRATIEQNI